MSGVVGGRQARGNVILRNGWLRAYVWPAFGATAAIMIALLVLSIRAMRAREAALRALEATARRQRDADGDGDRDGEQNAPA